MRGKTLGRIHLIATLIAVITIVTFFTTSLIAEIRGDEFFIKSVKAFILYALPVMIVLMPALAITGKKFFGLANLTLIVLNARNGMQLSGRLSKTKVKINELK